MMVFAGIGVLAVFGAGMAVVVASMAAEDWPGWYLVGRIAAFFGGWGIIAWAAASLEGWFS